MIKIGLVIPSRRGEAIKELNESLDTCIDYDKFSVSYVAHAGTTTPFVEKLNRSVEKLRKKGVNWYIFLHDDAEVTPGWLDVLPKNGVGSFCLGENNDSFDIWGGFIDPPGYCTDPRENPDYSYWLCISREAMEKIGSLDERYKNPMYQDVDMGLQIKKAGYKIECLPGKIIHHNGEGSGTPDERQRGYLNRKWDISL